MALNSTLTHLAVIDINGVLLSYCNTLIPARGQRLNFERKDV